MTLMILGLAIWTIAHMVPVLSPATRGRMVAAMGETPWKGAFSLVMLLSLALIVIGYRQAEFSNVWFPPVWGVHLNNLMMLIAVGLLGASHSKGNVRRFVRHPMLLAVIVWGAAHLLVNGDLASVVLFGWMVVWAVASILLINARDGAWVRPAPGPVKKDVILVVITLVAFGVITGIHMALGVSPFPA